MLIITSPKDINMYFLLGLKGMLKMEIYGMRKSGISAAKQVRGILNVKTKDKQELFKMFTDYINALKEN